MEKTAGIFLITKSKKVLICHPTYHDDLSWSIPKGLIDDHEWSFAAAVRELYEETNIEYEDIMNDVTHILKLDEIKYQKRKKYLVPYFIKLKTDKVDDFDLKCDSMVEVKGRNPFPEVDKFKWVDFDEALVLLHETQTMALMEYIAR